LLLAVGVSTALYLLLNAAFLQVLPLDRIAASNLVAGDLMEAVFGLRGGAVMAGVALLVVVASLNGNIFVTPRVIFGLAREGLAPAALARVNRGGTPWAAMLLFGLVALILAASGTFETLLGLAVALVLMIDGFVALSLFRLRVREPAAPFSVPLYPAVPLVFVATYAALLIGTAWVQPVLVAVTSGLLALAYGLSRAANLPARRPV
jgi:APA family basic amino acid/polyamine antiporter